jgi:hypothetical protein
MFFSDANVFDPVLIVGQIVVIQSSFYLIVGLMLLLLRCVLVFNPVNTTLIRYHIHSTIFATELTLDYVLDAQQMVSYMFSVFLFVVGVWFDAFFPCTFVLARPLLQAGPASSHSFSLPYLCTYIF